VQVFLDHGAGADVRDNNGNTALHLAAACGRVGIDQILLGLGAKAKPRDDEGPIPSPQALDGWGGRICGGCAIIGEPRCRCAGVQR
jgi:hypothetical protein